MTHLPRSPGPPMWQMSRPASWRVEPAQYPLDVVRQAVGCSLQASHLPAEARTGPVPSVQASPEVDLESFDLLPAGEGDETSLQADVRRLDPGAGVRAPVDVDRHRLGEVRKAPFKLADQVCGPLLGLHDRELAELD